MASKRVQRAAKFFLKLAVAGVAIYFVFTQLEWEDLKGLYQQLKWPYLLPAALLFASSKAVSAVRLNRFFKAKQLVVSEAINLRRYLLGMFYNLFLPGGIGGDGYKVYWLNKRYKTPVKDLVWASLHDRLNGLFGLVVLATVCLAVLVEESTWRLLLVATLPLLYGAYYLGLKWFFKDFVPVFWRSNLLSLGVQGLQVACAYLLLLALGVEEGLPAYLLLFLLSSIIAIVPVTPGAIGLREVVALFGADLLLIDDKVSVSVSLAFNLITILVSFCGIYFMLRPNKIAPGEDILPLHPE
ncbi:MAG: lysylphosphatidylglycerol synthase transmembrane domain-containing protein [Salibacteraceae bacterium]